MIQKRLLNRFKDKNPSPLNNLDFILNHTYEQIINMALTIEKLNKDFKTISSKLACAIEIVLMLLRIKTKMSEDQYDILRSYFSPQIDCDSETGWEEATQASVVHLLKYCLSGQGKSLVLAGTTKMVELTDTNKLKGNI